MEYRNALVSDKPKITEYCEKYKIDVPEESVVIFIAVDENTGDIKGITSLKKVFMIEPLISESAVVANNLFRMIDGFVKGNGIKKIRATVDNDDEKFMKVLDKEKFKLINLSKSTVER